MKWEMLPFITNHLNLLKTDDRNERGNPQEERTSPIPIMKGRILETQCKTQSNVQESICKVSYSLHSLFGHTGLKQLKKIVQQRFGDTAATNLPQKMANCAHCSVMKSICHNFLTSQGHTVLPMDVVGTDLMCPFDGTLPSGGRYALMIRDIGSTYGECHILLCKADATTILLQVLAKWERKTTRKVKVLNSTNGGEFCNASINWGTMHEKSLPYNHKQNSTIEQYNRSIADMGWTLLRSSGLPTPFWGFAFVWAAHVQNSKTDEKTPKELLFGEQPFYKQLRVFGEKVFVHVPKEKQQKLDDQVIEGRVFILSPNNKGWLFFIPATKLLTSSVWADLPDSADGVRTIQWWNIKNPCGKGYEQKKTDISFILNNLTLGEFTREDQVRSQDNLADQLSTMAAAVPVPKTYKQAMNSPDSAQWRTAVEEELRNMDNMGVYEIAPLQAEDKFGLTFAPTATFTSLRVLLTIVGLCKCYVNSFDFVAAYLNTDIKENIWVRPPDGLTVPPSFGCKLQKALYGTKQASYWIIWLHIDDGIVAAEDPVMLTEIRRELGESFRLKWEEGCESIIGVDITTVERGFNLNQGCLIQSIIDTTWNATPATKTPLPAKCNLVTLGENEG
ncbi:hypothetical protein O181_063675 [Austropuccinia psidii MF-1]|uniref:Reverse transcriptase Ty1/copia-type domain-containing protein n=1 Tax=Austropuccinia psidii MF-1 TaxID=1389203 RepID=A0A9Q3I2E7_9BASI|nr:hypothetical protein [Austropuccinia psidii MF-1]